MEKNWYDVVSDRWIGEGTNYGRVFEFHIRIGSAFEAGGMLETSTDCEPGDGPSRVDQIQRIIVRNQRTLEEVTLAHDSEHVRRCFNNLCKSLT